MDSPVQATTTRPAGSSLIEQHRAFIIWRGSVQECIAGASNNHCPACGRKQLKVYLPAWQPLTNAKGFLADAFYARCRRPDCGCTIGDFRELHPEGGYYGATPPPEPDHLYLLALLVQRPEGPKVSVNGAPIRLGDYDATPHLVVKEPGKITTPEEASVHLHALATETTAQGRLLLISPHVVISWFRSLSGPIHGK